MKSGAAVNKVCADAVSIALHAREYRFLDNVPIIPSRLPARQLSSQLAKVQQYGNSVRAWRCIVKYTNVFKII